MKFSIVTPVYNGERHLAETIESVLGQEGDFDIEYIVMDGGSTDGTMEIVRGYEERIARGDFTRKTLHSVSEKDGGMYDAITKGFARTSGNVIAYINADDRYLPGAFAAVAAIFERYPDIAWAKGINQTSDESGVITGQGSCLIYRQDWLQKGLYGRVAPFVQQDSVFWRRELWEASKPSIAQYRLAGDYALWCAFAKLASLWSFDVPVSVFRRRPGQLSGDMTPYRAEQERIAPRRFFLEKRVALFFLLARSLGTPQSIFVRALHRLLFPLSGAGQYLHFNTNGVPEKMRARSYAV